MGLSGSKRKRRHEGRKGKNRQGDYSGQFRVEHGAGAAKEIKKHEEQSRTKYGQNEAEIEKRKMRDALKTPPYGSKLDGNSGSRNSSSYEHSVGTSRSSAYKPASDMGNREQSGSTPVKRNIWKRLGNSK